MSHTVPQGDGQVSRLHTMALSKEIGDRLRLGMDSERPVIPLHLLKLTQFQRAELTQAIETSRKRFIPTDAD